MKFSTIYFFILILSFSCKENSKGKHLVSFPISDSQKVELLYFPGHATVQSAIQLNKIQGKNKIVLGKIVGLMDLDYDFEYKIINDTLVKINFNYENKPYTHFVIHLNKPQQVYSALTY